MIQSMASKNKNSDITHPYFTPDLTLNQSDISHPLVTAHSNPSYVSIITPTILRGIPHDAPQAFSVYRIEGFFQVHKVRVQTRPPFA